MAIDNFTGKNIQDTYQRVVQTDGVRLADGTGSLLPISFEGDDVIIPGALKAQSYIVSESITAVTSGSTIFGNSNNTTDQIKVFTSNDNSTYYENQGHFVNQQFSTGDFCVNITGTGARYYRISQGNTTGSGKSLTVITSKK